VAYSQVSEESIPISEGMDPDNWLLSHLLRKGMAVRNWIKTKCSKNEKEKEVYNSDKETSNPISVGRDESWFSESSL